MLFDLLAFLTISYLVVMGFVLMILGSLQEAARSRPGLRTRWNIAAWSRARFVAAAAVLTLPALLILVPLGLIFVV